MGGNGTQTRGHPDGKGSIKKRTKIHLRMSDPFIEEKVGPRWGTAGQRARDKVRRKVSGACQNLYKRAINRIKPGRKRDEKERRSRTWGERGTKESL